MILLIESSVSLIVFFAFITLIYHVTHRILILQFLSVPTEPHDGVDIELDAKRARIESYSGSAERNPPALAEAEAGALSQRKETRAKELEGQTARLEVQSKVDGAIADDDEDSRNGVEVENGESLSDIARRAALKSNRAAEIKQQEFSLLKLARNGMVYISIPSRSPGDLVAFFTKTIKDFHSRSRAAPRCFHDVSCSS